MKSDGKAVEISLDGPAEVLGFNAVKRREVPIQHHPLTAYQENGLFDLFQLNQRRPGVHAVERSVLVWTDQASLRRVQDSNLES